jgi:hypothetical protein
MRTEDEEGQAGGVAEARARTMLLQGYSVHQVATACGMSVGVVAEIADELGRLPRRERD